MRGKDIFTEEEANEIRELLVKKIASSTKDQQKIRRILRKRLEFHIRDFTNKNGFTVDDFNELVQSGILTIV